MKPIDELLEKWRQDAAEAELHENATTYWRWIKELTAIKDHLCEPVGIERSEGVPGGDPSVIVSKPFQLKVRLTEQEQALEAWMQEVTDTIVAGQGAGIDQQKLVFDAFTAYRRAIGKPAG